jgi:type I restriction enzyme, S subunit
VTAASVPVPITTGRSLAFPPPAHWEVKPLRYLFKSVGGATPSKDDPDYWKGEIPWVSPKDMKSPVILDSEDHISESALRETRLALLSPSTVLIVVRGMILAHTIPVALAAREVTINQDMKGLFPSSKILPQYFAHLLRAIAPILLSTVEEAGHGTRCLRLDLWRNILVGVPDLEEQRQIVIFIERKTAQIDELIGKRQRQIELLQEKRRAIISEAVTKGLDPTTPTKDSGIEWLSKIPAHWNASRIKWLAKMESGHTPDKKIEAYWTNCDIPWVSLNDTGYLKIHDYIHETAYYVNLLGIAHSSARLLPARAVVFSRDATIGRCAITTRPMAVSQHFIAWLCGPELRPEYLLHVLRSMTQELERLTMGATLKTIGMPDVKTLAIPVPPLEDQQSIVDHITVETKAIDAILDRIRAQLGKLREYRQALITAAVTGKIGVGEGAVLP